jgi:hypothetical protein
VWLCAGLDGLLRKCLTDGKALVVEGLHCHAVRARCAAAKASVSLQHAESTNLPLCWQAVYTSRIQELLSENAEGSRQCQPVVVPIAVRMNDADREVRDRPTPQVGTDSVSLV